MQTGLNAVLIRRFAIGCWAFLGLLGGHTALGQTQTEPILAPATHEDILEAIQASDARVTIVNMWATWCAPCVEEFPDFVRLGREFANQGVEVVFVSADFEEDAAAAQDFLERQGVTGTSYLKQGNDNAFIQAFHANWSGALPATFLYTEDGTLAEFWQSKTEYAYLRERVEALLK